LPRVLASALRLFRGYAGYLKGNGFAALLEKLPVKQIEACPKPLAISAVDITRKKEKIFTRGNLIKAIQASGSVPMLFRPTEIDGALYLDGGISGKAPVEALADLCDLDRILIHFIASENVKKEGNGFMKKRFTPGECSTSPSIPPGWRIMKGRKRSFGCEGWRLLKSTPAVLPWAPTT
jgi:predicted acylesterase/phospholipase RssA